MSHNPLLELNQHRYERCCLSMIHAYFGKCHKVRCSFWLAADDWLVDLNIQHTVNSSIEVISLVVDIRH